MKVDRSALFIGTLCLSSSMIPTATPVAGMVAMFGVLVGCALIAWSFQNDD